MERTYRVPFEDVAHLFERQDPGYGGAPWIDNSLRCPRSGDLAHHAAVAASDLTALERMEAHVASCPGGRHGTRCVTCGRVGV